MRSASRLMPSFFMALTFCVLMVCTLRCERSAISVMVSPEPNRRTISASRGVSRSLCEESTWLTKMSLIDGEKYWFRE